MFHLELYKFIWVFFTSSSNAYKLLFNLLLKHDRI